MLAALRDTEWKGA